MDEIIQILIFVGAMVIMVVQQNAKAKKKPQKASPVPEDVLEEVFPKLKMENPAPERPLKKEAKPRPKRQSAPKETVAPPPPSRPAQASSRIKLSTREEAKRAFIHSEIFNRKY